MKFNGRKIRDLRDKLTVPAFIAEVGLDVKSPTTIHNWEENNSEPNPTQLAKISRHYNVELYTFFIEE